MTSLRTSHKVHCHLDCLTLDLRFSLFSSVEHHPLIDHWPISWQGDLRHRRNDQNVGLWHRYSPSNGLLTSSCEAKRRTLRWHYLRGGDLSSSFTCCREWHRVVAFYWHIRTRWCCPSFIRRNREGHKRWFPWSQKQPTSGWSQVIENKAWHAIRDDQSPQRNLEVLWVNYTIITPEEKRHNDCSLASSVKENLTFLWELLTALHSWKLAGASSVSALGIFRT